MDTNLLKSKMVLSNVSVRDLSKHLEISESSLYPKLRGEREFKLSEINKIKSFLNLSADEVYEIFIK